MSEVTKHIPIVQINKDELMRKDDCVIREAHVAIYIEEKQVLSAPCLDSERELFVYGALFTQTGIFPQDVERIEWKGLTAFVHLKEGAVAAEATPGLVRVALEPRFSAQAISSIVEQFQQLSDLFKTTGAVHVAALCSSDEILYWYEDISRRTAIDKVIGNWLLSGRETAGQTRNLGATEELFLLTSGRISTDILMRAVRTGVPMMVSVAPPSDKAVEIAHKQRLTLIGFARPPRMNVYTHSIRIK
jgi:FdhD protein